MALKPSASISLKEVGELADEIATQAAEGVDAAILTRGTVTIEKAAFALAAIARTNIPLRASRRKSLVVSTEVASSP